MTVYAFTATDGVTSYSIECDDIDLTLALTTTTTSIYVASGNRYDVQGALAAVDAIIAANSNDVPAWFFSGLLDYVRATDVDTFDSVGLVYNASGAGAGATAYARAGAGATGSIVGHPGVGDFTTGTTATGRYGAWFLYSAAASYQSLTPGSRLGWLIRIDALSSALQEYSLRFGALDSLTGAPADGVYFEYDRGTAPNLTTWTLKTAKASARSTATGGTDVAVATGWTYLEWRVSADGLTVSGYVGGVHIGDVTSNLPTTLTNFFIGGFQLISSVGTTPKIVGVDRVAYGIEFPTPRAVVV